MDIDEKKEELMVPVKKAVEEIKDLERGIIEAMA